MIPYYNIVSLYDRLFVCLFVWVVVAYVYVCLMFCLFALHTEVLPHGLAALRYMFTCCMVYGGGGVIDQDYRGEIKIIIINNGFSTFIINEGDFIAQIIPEQISNLPILLNKKMIVSYSERNGGFGSTDK